MPENKKEGYWRDGDKEWSSIPVEGPPWDKQGEFLLKLHILENKLKPTLYRGISICRICGIRNGHGEYSHAGFDWPSGYRHYVAIHNVEPSAEFFRMIMTMEPIKFPFTEKQVLAAAEKLNSIGLYHSWFTTSSKTKTIEELKRNDPLGYEEFIEIVKDILQATVISGE